MKKLIHKANLWDLHVHTPYYSSKSINNYNRDDSEDFCRKICNIIKDSKYGLDMISFTDHNHFNIECYQKFEEARKEININTVLLPGVEIDIYLNRDDTNYKHLIFYFDQSEDYEVLGSFLNSYFKKMKNNKIFLDDFIGLTD